MLTKLLGPSFKPRLAAIIVFVSGLGGIVAHTALGKTPVGATIEIVSEITALVGVAFGFTSAKQNNVSNAPAPLPTAKPVNLPAQPTIN